MSFSSLSAGNALEQLTEKQRVGNEKSPLPPYINNDVGDPIEDSNTAIQKMIDAGFDLDKDINDEEIHHKMIEHKSDPITPMIYFCLRKGDLKMCRYLFANGATCTQTTKSGFWFPMYAAALRGNLNICRWLYEHGAKEDIRKRNTSDYSPLCVACNHNSTLSTAQWLILNGAASCRHDPGQIDTAVSKQDLIFLNHEKGNRLMLLWWADEELKTQNHFLLFLCGKQTQQIFAGKSGILEYMADFVGVVRGKNLRMIRQLADFLRADIQDDDDYN